MMNWQTEVEEDEEGETLFGSPSTNFDNGRISSAAQYDIWMAEPISIEERRKRLLQGMGLGNNKELLRVTSIEFNRSNTSQQQQEQHDQSTESESSNPNKQTPSSSSSSSCNSPPTITRSKSDTLVSIRKEEEQDHRSSSAPSSPIRKQALSQFPITENGESHVCKIKNLDNGKEFIVDGTWNGLSEAQTGRLLTMEEFEKCVGYSPIVKELMRRENVAQDEDDDPNNGNNEDLLRIASSKSSIKKKNGSGWLKNIKVVANSVTNAAHSRVFDRSGRYVSDNGNHHSDSHSQPVPERLKVKQHGKSVKELSALFLSQEIQAHEGCIWSIRFSLDGRYLASAGEDCVIHVWLVVELEGKFDGVGGCGNSSSSTCSRHHSSASLDIERKKKGKIPLVSRRSSTSVLDHVVVPETVFSLSEKPECSFQGHLDDVLDLSWSKSQYLLSSSMDKTVRLWDLSTKACLKMFAHNDYVTCIQFNPVDDRYFISGSLDAKVRLWSIPDRQVVDWSDLHEMVTAACYTPDGQGALVGSHKGKCRFYSTIDCKLQQKGQIVVQSKKKKSQAKKITGFQFDPENPSEVLITSADSRIRIYDGVDLINKFKGFRNTSSQISASFTIDGKYIVCASEDSHVYVWKREETTTHGIGSNGRSKTKTSHEHFPCKDVSVAITWNGGTSHAEPLPPPSMHCTKAEPLSLSSRSRGQRYYSSRHPHSEPLGPSGGPTLEDVFLMIRSGSIPQNPHSKKAHSKRMWVCPEEELGNDNSPSGSRNGSVASAAVASSPSSASLRWHDGNGGSCNSSHGSTAWGLVIVTAGQGGEIRAYQNFGLPIRI